MTTCNTTTNPPVHVATNNNPRCDCGELQNLFRRRLCSDRTLAHIHQLLRDSGSAVITRKGIKMEFRKSSTYGIDWRARIKTPMADGPSGPVAVRHAWQQGNQPSLTEAVREIERRAHHV